MPEAKNILPVIVLSQFCCTSLWFAGNGIMNDLVSEFGLQITALGHLTSAVQIGFILGTLLFALLNVADRFSPSKVFFVCALFGAFVNMGMIWEGNQLESLIGIRFLTGFALAGIYPVGMKIASDHYREGLGTSLGFLVGALVLGTAFPHLLKTFTGTGNLPWKSVVWGTSVLSTVGGLLIYFLIPDGPFRLAMIKKDFSVLFSVFKLNEFQAAAFGYFGHMWELYAFWAFVPLVLEWYRVEHSLTLNIPLYSFVIIGSGGLACVAAGFLSQTFGTKRTAGTALLLSGLCCLISPFFFWQNSALALLLFLIFWGVMVVADSPLFSTLVAQNAPGEARGTALTIVNCIGFFITIFSIQLLNLVIISFSPLYLFLFLTPGPMLGLYFLFKRK